VADYSINVPLLIIRNKIPWMHTLVRCAAHAYDLEQNRLFLGTLLAFSNFYMIWKFISHIHYIF